MAESFFLISCMAVAWMNSCFVDIIYSCFIASTILTLICFSKLKSMQIIRLLNITAIGFYLKQKSLHSLLSDTQLINYQDRYSYYSVYQSNFPIFLSIII